MRSFEKAFGRLAALVVVAAVGLAACRNASSGNPLGSSARTNSPSSSTAPLVTHTVLSGGASGTWNGLTLGTHIQNNETMAAGPVNPLTGAASLQISAASATGCIPTVPPSPCNPPFNNYQTNGSLRLATCKPAIVGTNCPPVPSDWLVPKTGSSIQMDLKLDVPTNDINNVWVYWGNPGCSRSYRLSPTQVTAAAAAFTRISMPLSAFTATHSCLSLDDITVFQLVVERIGRGSASPAIMAVDNVLFIN